MQQQCTVAACFLFYPFLTSTNPNTLTPPFQLLTAQIETTRTYEAELTTCKSNLEREKKARNVAMEKLQQWQSKCEALLEERTNSTNWGGAGGGAGGGGGQRTRTLTGASVSFGGARELKGRRTSEDYNTTPKGESENASILRNATERRGSELGEDRESEGKEREATGNGMGRETAGEEKVGLKEILIRSLETSADVLGKILSEDREEEEDHDDFFGSAFGFQQAEGGGMDQRETGTSSPARMSRSALSLKAPKTPQSPKSHNKPQVNAKGGRRKSGAATPPRRKKLEQANNPKRPIVRTTSKNVPILSLDLTNL